MALHFTNITKEEFLSKKLLYKFMPLENALKTLSTQELWFADPASWKDPFEKRFLFPEYIDSNVKVDALLTFKVEDFYDICLKKHIEIISGNENDLK